MAFKVGDIYICTESKVDWWTEGEEYEVKLNIASLPRLFDNEGFGWNESSYDIASKFKLKEEKAMKFKKDDIVEVIKEDKWQGINYPVGTQLRVCGDQGNDSVVRIYDSMQKQGGYAKLWEWNLKLVKREGENEMEFKVEETPDPEAILEEPTTYTKSEINHQIAKAYQHFKTDAERLAYLQGYFTK